MRHVRGTLRADSTDCLAGQVALDVALTPQEEAPETVVGVTMAFCSMVELRTFGPTA